MTSKDTSKQLRTGTYKYGIYQTITNSLLFIFILLIATQPYAPILLAVLMSVWLVITATIRTYLITTHVEPNKKPYLDMYGINTEISYKLMQGISIIIMIPTWILSERLYNDGNKSWIAVLIVTGVIGYIVKYIIKMLYSQATYLTITKAYDTTHALRASRKFMMKNYMAYIKISMSCLLPTTVTLITYGMFNIYTYPTKQAQITSLGKEL